MENTFEVVSGAIVCSDPCYSIPTWCQGIVENVKNGTWIAQVIKSDEGDWGERIAMLSISHKDVEDAEANVDIMDFVGGVDSGQFGFFDKDFYRNDEKAKDLEKYSFSSDFDKEGGDEWYRACCNLTLSSEQWGVLPNGVVSSSGFGDGSYDVFGYKDESGQYVAFAVVFIYDDEDEEEEEVECNNCGGIMSLKEDETIYICTNKECTSCYEEE
jgi:hypothetical protein